MQTSSEGKVAFNCGPVKCNFCEFCINMCIGMVLKTPKRIVMVSKNEMGPHEMLPCRGGKQDHHMWCCQTLRTEIETRSSRADRTNFGSEDIEWFLFCWHRNRCRLMRICLLLYAVFNIHPPDRRWHEPVVFFESTSRYRVLRDLHTFGHPNKSRSLGKIGKVAYSVTPSACPLKCFVAISPLWDTSKGKELRRLLQGRTTFDTPCILQAEVQIALLPSLFPI